MTVDPSPIFPWLHHHWLTLCKYRSQNKVPQALLIAGKQGLGKQQLAEQFAFSLLCANPDSSGICCGICPSCRLIGAGTHPDLIFIKPSEPGKGIGIASIRSIIAETSLKPQYDKYRIVLINPADQLNRSAANAFLKCLEEPGDRTLFLLICEKPSNLPATIVSRCQKLTVATPSADSTMAWLKQQQVDRDLATLSALSQNAPLTARSYADQRTMEQRNDCLRSWLAVAQGQADPIALAENWMKQPPSDLLFWLTSWTIDLIKSAYHEQPHGLYHPDQGPALQELARKLDLSGLYKLYDLLLNSRRWLETQLNKQLMFEEIIFLWSKLAGSR